MKKENSKEYFHPKSDRKIRIFSIGRKKQYSYKKKKKKECQL